MRGRCLGCVLEREVTETQKMVERRATMQYAAEDFIFVIGVELKQNTQWKGTFATMAFRDRSVQQNEPISVPFEKMEKNMLLMVTDAKPIMNSRIHGTGIITTRHICDVSVYRYDIGKMSYT